MEFPRPEYWSGKHIPSPEDLPDPGIELGSPALQVDSLPTELPEKPQKRGRHHKRHNQQCEKAPGGMRKNSCQTYTYKGIILTIYKEVLRLNNDN